MFRSQFLGKRAVLALMTMALMSTRADALQHFSTACPTATPFDRIDNLVCVSEARAGHAAITSIESPTSASLISACVGELLQTILICSSPEATREEQRRCSEDAVEEYLLCVNSESGPMQSEELQEASSVKDCWAAYLETKKFCLGNLEGEDEELCVEDAEEERDNCVAAAKARYGVPLEE